MKIDKALMLSEIKDYLGFTKDAQLARYLGISPQTLSSWISRNTFDIYLLYSKCVFLNAEWLLTGKGNMLKSEFSMNEDVTNEGLLHEKSSEYINQSEYWKDQYIKVNMKYTALLENRLAEVIDKRKTNAV